jgi:hypothetical protein
MSGPRLVVAGILFSLLGALGCAQGVGGRCVQDSDCQSGNCSTKGGDPRGGTCQSSTQVITATGGAGGGAGVGGGAGGAAGSAGAGGAGGAGGGDAAATNDGAATLDAAPVSDAAGGQGGSSRDAQID